MARERAPARNAGLPLAEQMIEAHGGAALWNRLQEVQVRAAFGGTGFRMKLLKVPIRATITVRRGGQHVTLGPYPSTGRRGVFEGSEVRIESADGRVLSSRSQPRLAFRDFRHLFRWDALDLLYFAGYAMWTYLCVPFVLTDPAYELRPAGTWQEGGQTWRKLHVRFPSGIHTHSRDQVLYADERGRIVRHDYTAEPFGAGAKAAHYSTGHQDFNGLVVPARRRVHPRRADGTPRPHPTLVWINVEDVAVVAGNQITGGPPRGGRTHDNDRAGVRADQALPGGHRP